MHEIAKDNLTYMYQLLRHVVIHDLDRYRLLVLHLYCDAAYLYLLYTAFVHVLHSTCRSVQSEGNAVIHAVHLATPSVNSKHCNATPTQKRPIPSIYPPPRSYSTSAAPPNYQPPPLTSCPAFYHRVQPFKDAVLDTPLQ
jgi:hypothetical protein